MRWFLPLVSIAALPACSKAPSPPKAIETEVPDELRQQTAPLPGPTGETVGTPMKDRVATLGLLNKRNNISQDITIKPGETRRFGDVIVALKACERTAPWEMPEETGAFVQMWVKEARQSGFRKTFSGWLFRESPSLNVVEHPIYDVWVKDCTMRFPGEEATAAPDKGAPTKPKAPAASPAPEPSPSPSATSESTA